MFERYTEKARRVIFFGRDEASEFGCEAIEADFLLLGIAREAPELCIRWLGADYVELRVSAARMYNRDKQIAKHVDLPLSSASKRVLAYAEEEADRLADGRIGAEHLFLGLLREGGTATKLLKSRQRDVKNVRVAIAQEPRQSEAKTTNLRASSPDMPDIQMKLVTEDGSYVTVIWWQRPTPGIGEAIRIPDGEGGEITYRIRDLCWCMETSECADLRLSEVQLTVRME